MCQMEPHRSSFGSRKLYVEIMFSFLCQLFITVLGTTWFTYTNNEQSLFKVADEVIGKISKAAIDKTITYLNNAQVMAKIGANLVKGSKNVSLDNAEILSFMRSALEAYPYLSSIYVGVEAGDFLQVRSLPPNTPYRTDPTKLLPGGSLFAYRYIERSKGTPVEYWKYLDTNGKVIEEETLPKVMFNHLVRTWYVNVSQSRAISWSDIYIFNASRTPGITASYPLLDTNGHFFGVIAVDLEMSAMSEFMMEPQIGPDFLSFIISSKGEVVASTDVNQMMRAEGDNVKALLIDESKDPRMLLSHQIRINSKQNKFVFTAGDKQYVASFTSFPQSFGKEWELGIVIPIDTFVGDMKHTQKLIILMSFIIFMISGFLVYIQAKRIARPIVRLADEATRIKNFELEQTTSVDSSIYEIQMLNNSIVAMRQSMRAFSKFIPKVLVGKLLKTNHELKIGGKMRRATLLFTDVANFTTVCENYPPERLVLHLSEYFEEVTDIIMKTNGIIDKYIGDAVMAFWGAPIADKDQALHACTAALTLQHRLSDLNRKWAVEGKPALETRIGIHIGEAIIGNIGSSDRMNYTALGDTVNLASRLEGTNKVYHTHICISEDVLKEVGKKCLVRPLDVVAVKGKEKGVKIYELVGLMSSPDPALMPSDHQIEFCRLFERAFALYLDQRWDEALEKLHVLEEKFGREHTITMYMDRCEAFKTNPPPENWDGVMHLKEK